jgi:hypothetical protein
MFQPFPVVPIKRQPKRSFSVSKADQAVPAGSQKRQATNMPALNRANVFHELRVGGPLYPKIKLGNDLVADILPRPAYVIKAYLEATLALREP